MKTRKANPWGLYDVHGNVYEWVWDWYGLYGSAAQRDPPGPDKGATRVVRGGSFVNSLGLLRSANRGRIRAGFRDWDLGLRCVRGGAILSGPHSTRDVVETMPNDGEPSPLPPPPP